MRAKSEKKTAEIAAEKSEKTEKQDKAEKKPLMYVGPTIPGIAIQNTVYADIPDGAKKEAEKRPIVLDLFIPISDYPKAEQQIRARTGHIYAAFTKMKE